MPQPDVAAAPSPAQARAARREKHSRVILPGIHLDHNRLNPFSPGEFSGRFTWWKVSLPQQGRSEMRFKVFPSWNIAELLALLLAVPGGCPRLGKVCQGSCPGATSPQCSLPCRSLRASPLLCAVFPRAQLCLVPLPTPAVPSVPFPTTGTL